MIRVNLNPFEFEPQTPIALYDYAGYVGLVESITDKVHWTVNSGYNDYQGTLYMFGYSRENPKKVYFVAIGYGSCSYCDALEACDSDEDIMELRDSIRRSIREFESILDFEKWFNTQAHLEFWLGEDTEEFIARMNSTYELNLEYKED